jgi:hypothetical protein
VSSILYNFPNQSLQNNFDSKNVPPIQKARTIVKDGVMQIDNIPRVAYYDHTERRTSIFQISEPTVFDSNYKPTVLQILTPNIIRLSCTKEEESKQETSSNKDPKVTQKGDPTQYLNNCRNFNQ